MSKEDLALINPNTKTCPVFRTRKDAEVTRKLYRAAPVLMNEEKSENPWNIRFQTLFHMANDSRFFRTREDLECKGFQLNGFEFRGDEEVYVPLFEGKMFGAYNSRAADVSVNNNNLLRKGQRASFTSEMLVDPLRLAMPHFWVNKRELVKILSAYNTESGFIAYKAVTSPTNERMMICTWLPQVALHHNAPIILSKYNTTNLICLLSNFNSFIFDFILRNKADTTYLSFFYLMQVPIIKHTSYNKFASNFITINILELIYTAWDLKTFADDLWREADEPLRAALKQQWDKNVAETDGGHAGAEPPSWAEIARDGFPYPPFKWDEERRAKLRAELDAIYAHLYGLTKEELDYILETFPIVKRKDIEKYGSYRTKEMILNYYEAYIDKISSE